jgi:hypothetical protein
MCTTLDCHTLERICLDKQNFFIGPMLAVV